MDTKIISEDERTKLMSLSGVKQYPMRVKCATLAWHTLTSAINEIGINRFGFELTAESGNNKTGTFLITDPTETKFATGTNNTAVTHTTAGTSGSTTKSWSMNWTATANSSVSTTFYAALVFANNNGNNNGDNVFTDSLLVVEGVLPSWDCLPIIGCQDPGTGTGI